MANPEQESVATTTHLEQEKPPRGSLSFLHVVHLIYCYVLNVGFNISNLPVPQDQPPANGSSRSWGATSRGRSHGNVHNIGDPSPVQADIHDPLPRGRVNLTIVNERPTTLSVENASSIIKVATSCYHTVSPLLRQISWSYSPVRSKFLYIL